MFDNEVSNINDEGETQRNSASSFSRAFSPSNFSQLSNRSNRSNRSSPSLWSSPSNERRNIADWRSALIETLQKSNPLERINTLKQLKDCVNLFEMQIKVDNEISISTSAVYNNDNTNALNAKWSTVKIFDEFDLAEEWLRQTYNARVSGTSKTLVFKDMVNMVSKSNHNIFTWKRYECNKEPYSLKIVYQEEKFFVQESILSRKRAKPMEAEETTDRCVRKSLHGASDEIGIPFELKKAILFMYNNQCKPKNISDKLRHADDDQLMELFKSEDTLQVSTYNHFPLN